MILTTFIVSFYMLAVFVIGGEEFGTYMKLILVGITTIGIIMQVSRGRGKGKSFAEALVDDEMSGISELVTTTKSVAASIVRGSEEE